MTRLTTSPAFSSARVRPAPEELAGGAVVSELVDRNARGLDVEGVEGLCFDPLQIVEGGEPNRDMGVYLAPM